MKINDATFTVLPVSGTGQAKPQPDDTSVWRPGQILRATVMALKDGQVTLQMSGRTVAARSTLGLREGQQLLLHVTSSAGEVQLQPLGLNPENQHKALLQLLDAGWKLPALARHLQSRDHREKNPLLDPFGKALKMFMEGVEGSTGKVDGNILTTLLESLGVIRLKHDQPPANLSQTLTLLFEEGIDGKDAATERATDALQGLDMIRHFNLQREAEGIALLPLPLPFIEQGFLLVEDCGERPEAESNASKKLSIFLSLERLGELRIDMLWDADKLRIKFTCDKPKTSRMLSAFSEELCQALHFGPSPEILFTTGKTRPEEDFMAHLGNDTHGFVNTRI
ncbi:FliK domain protein [Syntrophotalea carbinolica DSM 2380]|uniref:FliK domain protein n=1 Tax=Syntrophotalea carbinolica (strain DSM 2380 / NBRC 103641 / GraBd1) TaxID=338963 RepID=Q3A5K2_SYNC1|nr:flagellar hook-length control protein FliK [Syntrophotalea carbinolica]ABA88355.1 FliK domain protein [Syntrophotalea carbinolica DSM 2380]